MNVTELRQLAEDRILDAEALLVAQRWSAAYYLAGYAAECGLKACVLGHVLRTGIIFSDKKYAEKCWTHNLVELVKLADLEADLNAALAAGSVFAFNWSIVKDWTEASRYLQVTQAAAQAYFNALTDPVDGIMPWIRRHW